MSEENESRKDLKNLEKLFNAADVLINAQKENTWLKGNQPFSLPKLVRRLSFSAQQIKAHVVQEYDAAGAAKKEILGNAYNHAERILAELNAVTKIFEEEIDNNWQTIISNYNAGLGPKTK